MRTALLPPKLCRKGLTSGKQTDLCVRDENALKVSVKTRRIPSLAKSPTFCQAARCEARARLWFHPQWMCFCLGCCCCRGVQEGSTSSIIDLFSSMWLKRNIFIICTINHSRWPMSRFQFWLYCCMTWLLIYSSWYSVLFLVSSLLTPKSQHWWSNFSPDNAIQFSVLTMKLSGVESTNGSSVLA